MKIVISESEVREAVCDAVKRKTGVDVAPSDLVMETENCYESGYSGYSFDFSTKVRQGEPPSADEPPF